MNVIHQVVDLINTTLEANLKLGDRAQYSCIADLVERDGRIQPIIKRNNQSASALPNNNYLLNVYHRITDGPESELIEGRGDDTYERFEVTMRLVGYANPQVFGTEVWTTRDIAMRVLDAMPNRMEFAASTARWVYAEKIGNVILDADVWQDEYPKADQDRGNPLRIPAFAFEYRITGELCAGYCLSGNAVTLPCAESSPAYALTYRLDWHPADNGYDQSIANLPADGTITDIDFSNHLTSVQVYVNDVPASIGTTFSQGDSIRVEVTRSSNGTTYVEIQATFSASASVQVNQWEWARWGNLTNMTIEDARFTDAPYSLKSTGGGNTGIPVYDKKAISAQSISWANDFTIEWGNCSLPLEMYVGFASTTATGLANMLGAISMDFITGFVEVLQSGSTVASVTATSLTQSHGGDTLSIYEDATLWRIRKVGNTAYYEVKPRGDAGSGTWHTIHSITTALGTTSVRAEIMFRFPNSYWNGVRLYGAWA